MLLETVLNSNFNFHMYLLISCEYMELAGAQRSPQTRYFLLHAHRYGCFFVYNYIKSPQIAQLPMSMAHRAGLFTGQIPGILFSRSVLYRIGEDNLKIISKQSFKEQKISLAYFILKNNRNPYFPTQPSLL